MRDARLFLTAAAAALLLGACYDAADIPDAQPAAEAATPISTEEPAAPAATPTPAVFSVTPSQNPEAQAIDKAEFIADATLDAVAAKRLMIKLQVLLDRARFGPGVIDGQAGENVRQAIAALEKANGLPEDGKLDAEVWNKLTVADKQGVMTDYVITDADAAGPYLAKIPAKYDQMAKLEKLSYTSPAEMLAEKFHMDEKLLRALNPDADFAKAGTSIIVTAPGNGELGAEVTRVEVDKAEREVRAFAGERLVAVYPATVGSADMPTPEGEWEVTSVAFDPVWNYDPAKLNFGDRKLGKLTIPAGPNNPVGAVWIDLSKDTYGIHGAPQPSKVGKTDSHGCVRLTNWDATALGKAVRKGTKVVFVEAKPVSAAT
jgi:lipoprotein-anchoring transpeptidase ErfK/SrfK